MTTYTFILTLASEDVLTPEISDKLYEAGINGDDTLVMSRGGSVFVEFEREARSLAEAVASAINQVEQAGFQVARVDVEGFAPVA
jgi:hypothetical protein